MTFRQHIKHFLYNKCPGFAGSFPYYGTEVHFPTGSAVFSLVCEQGIYEHFVVRTLLYLLSPESYYIDIGANIGLMSIPLLASNGNCRVLSFEASPETAGYLRKTIEGSRCGDRWQLISKAAGREIGTSSFYEPEAAMGAFGGFVNTGRIECQGHIRSVPVTTLDSEWQARLKPLVSIIKIDVEGAELQVLEGAVDCLSTCRPHIVLEWNLINLTANMCCISSLLLFSARHAYQVYSLPQMCLVSDLCTLRVQMLVTETFLLAPVH